MHKLWIALSTINRSWLSRFRPLLKILNTAMNKLNRPKLNLFKAFLLVKVIIVCWAVPNAAMALLPFQNTGNLYVSMWTANEIAVFSPDGTPVERFSADGLDGPRGIAFNPFNGEIWIASEFGNAIFIFDHTHRFLRKLEHPDFNEPVGVTFSFTSESIDNMSGYQVYISNSNGNEIMVFDESEQLVERFTGTALVDPNCSAFLDDGTLLVANRLGGTQGDGAGAVSSFDTSNQFQFDFTTTGISSLMAIARDTNALQSGLDDSVWVTSGGGDNGIYEFDQAGNLLMSLLPADIDDGRPVVPQGIAFDDEGSFVVVSYLNEVIKFDADGNFLNRFPTGPGTARSTAFQACESQPGANGECIALGANASLSTNAGEPQTESGTDSLESQNGVAITADTASSGGGGSVGFSMLVCLCWLYRFRLRVHRHRL